MDRLDFKIDYMMNSGSNVIKGISPIEPMLDLFVRESIQNSFDALLPDSNTLREEFDCGSFDSNKLAELFDGITQNLKSKYGNLNNYIAVRDYNTTGLTGVITKKEMKNNDWGKFLNLVRNFGKSQKTTGSGGSYGFGKATFYKIGIGIVIYYSRILDNGEYKERMMACLVENETNSNGLLYNIQNGNNTGIAWWGNKKNDDIFPITNHNEIMNVLNCFNYKAYEKKETGTAVIIPFIDKEALLNKTSSGSIVENNMVSWSYSIEEYLKLSFQRWYPTRCNNTTTQIKGIDVYINGRLIEKNKMRPLFKVIQNMYLKSCDEEFSSKYEINVEDILYGGNKIFKSKYLGRFFYVLLNDDDLEMTPPNNEPSPFTCATNKPNLEDTKKILICFCRKPGMILKYDNDGDWAGSIILHEPNKYMIGLFIPNSDNEIEIDGVNFTIDDYLRAAESAEHNDWKDINEYRINETGENVDCSKVELVKNVKRKIQSIFKKMRQDEELDNNIIVASFLNQKLTSLFLPQRGFGKLANKETDLPNKYSKSFISRKPYVKYSPIKIINDYFNKNFCITLNNNYKCTIEFRISLETGDMSIDEWEKIANIPFKINSIFVKNITLKNNNIITINKNLFDDFKCDYFDYQSLVSLKGNQYGLSLKINDNSIVSITGEINYKIVDSTISLSIHEGNGE